MATPAEIAAYIGAAAWLPQIGSWIYARVVHPRVGMMPAASFELGYTTLGPVINLQIAFTCDSRDAILERVEMLLTHEHGERRVLGWSDLKDTFSQISDTQGNTQFVTREQPAIAMKLSTLIVTEKGVRFKDASFTSKVTPLANGLVRQVKFIKSESGGGVTEALKASELRDMSEAFRTSFWWKPGRYDVEFELRSPNKAKLRRATYSFTLTEYDVDSLKKNLDNAHESLRDVVTAEMTGTPTKQFTWHWCYPVLVRTDPR
jgi:hypothetical protein